MKPSVKPLACLIVTLCAAIAFAQLASAQAQGDATAATSSSPSAYVYLINATSTNTSELDGYSADSNGSLTLIPGSPFWVFSTATGSLAHTAHWLFATDGNSIYSFSIASNGTLKEVSSVNAQEHVDNTYSIIGPLALDRTGSTLYAYVSDGVGDNQNQFWSKNNTTGALTYFGSTPVSAIAGVPYFLGNNVYAYNASCFMASPTWYAVRRNSDGSLTPFNVNPPLPNNPNGDFCPDGEAPDQTNNLAVAMLPNEQPPVQLAVYTADSSGNLTTHSTADNMPTAAVGNPYRLVISPGGSMLAIAGDQGLQVFHFHGGNPITSYTGLIAAHSIYDLAWDTHNHLFAIGSGLVNAFRVTSTSYNQAPGSPYPFNAIAITVLSKSSTATCAPPSSAGVKICSPANGSTVSSPVSVSAAATASSGLHITATRLYVDAKSVFTSNSNTLNTSVSMAAGTHNLTVVGYENNGSAVTARETITVK